MALFYIINMSLAAFDNMWKITRLLSQNKYTTYAIEDREKLNVTKFSTHNLWKVMFIIKRAKCFFKKIGHQRQREDMRNQPFIHLNSATIEIISGSNYE